MLLQFDIINTTLNNIFYSVYNSHLLYNHNFSVLRLKIVLSSRFFFYKTPSKIAI